MADFTAGLIGLSSHARIYTWGLQSRPRPLRVGVPDSRNEDTWSGCSCISDRFSLRGQFGNFSAEHDGRADDYDCGADDYDCGADDHRGADDHCGTDDHHGSTYNHRCTGNDNRSSRYDGRPNHNHPVRSSVRSWRPSR